MGGHSVPAAAVRIDNGECASPCSAAVADAWQAATSVEDLMEAFFNFDEDASGYISMDTLRLMVTLDGEPMHDVGPRPCTSSAHTLSSLSLSPFSRVCTVASHPWGICWSNDGCVLPASHTFPSS